jgi:ferric enterobactin receptor
MRCFIVVVSLLSALSGAQSTAAAQTAAELRGRIVDAKTGAPIGRAGVTVRRTGAEDVVSRVATALDGTFGIRGVVAGAYALRITSIGFAPATKEVGVVAGNPVVDVGIIMLSPVATTLAAMSVVEGRATITTETDRNSYRAKDVAPAAGNATEVLDAIPSVQVDADGKLSLRGSENVTVQIDGRPTPLSGAQLASYLRSLPANVVERVEVIPNPSAKHDAEGMAGIINLVLKRQVDLGTSVSVNGALSTRDRYNGSGTFGYQRGKLTAFTTAGITADRRGVVGINDRERYAARRQLLWATEEDIESSASNNGQNATMSTDVALRPGLSLSNAFSGNRHATGDASLNGFTERDASRAATARYDRPRVDRADGWMIDNNLAIKRAFEPGRHELSGEVRVNRAKDDDLLTLWRQSPGGSLAQPSAQVDAERNETHAASTQFSAQVDYVRSITQHAKIETGVKSTARWLDRDFLVTKDSLGDSRWATSPLSNSLRFNESVHATYVMASVRAGSLEMQGGLRAEYAERDFRLAESPTHYPHGAAGVYPSGNLVYNATAQTQLKASYSRRVRRPGTLELNPFPAFWDAQNVFVGNPQLDAEFTDAFELGVTRNGTLGMLQLSPFYRRTANAIRIEVNTADVIDGRHVTSLTLRNLAASTSWGADLTGSLRMGKRFNGMASANVFKLVSDGGALTSLSANAVSWSGRLNGTIEPVHTVTIQASYFYRAPLRVPRFEFARFQMMNASIRKSFNGDNASVTLRVSDPFNTGTFRARGGDENVVQLTERNMGMRQAFLAFQYNYGRPAQVREAKREQEGAPGFIPPA